MVLRSPVACGQEAASLPHFLERLIGHLGVRRCAGLRALSSEVVIGDDGTCVLIGGWIRARIGRPAIRGYGLQYILYHWRDRCRRIDSQASRIVLV